MMRKSLILSIFLLSVSTACSPLRSSANDEKHQLELTLHEVKTNLDDLRHDINCFQTELQIVDGRIKYYENSLSTLKQNELEKQQAKIEQILTQIQSLEKKWASLEKSQKGGLEELEELSSHANETTAALTQFKDRINELEDEIHTQNRKFEELSKLRGHIETLAKGVGSDFKLYRVGPGDSLKKIARDHKTSVEKIKKLNQLDQDLIVIGQQLKIPID
jgi:LysM repeat protein